MSQFRVETKTMRAAESGGESCLPDLLGERILQNHLEFQLGEEDEIYEGYGSLQNAYPYRQYNQYTRKLQPVRVQTIILENQYIKAVFLPEYGGRLWELWDKETGRNLLYTNDVLQLANLAVRNAWFSGGVEWNIGVIGHNPFTIDQLYTARLEDEEGNPVLRMYEYERIRGVVYQMDFWLGEEDRFLNCRMRIVNESTEVIPMYWWSNIAAPEYEKGNIIVPADQAYTFADGVVSKVDIPMVKGIDITEYQKIPKSVDYFFEIPKSDPKYIANVDETGYGLLHISTDRLRSRKLFSWGNGDASDHWQEFLTDRAGRYIEIQAGLGKTQYGCLPMAPHTAWEWMEQYGPVRIPEEIRRKPHAGRAAYLTGQILDSARWEQMEEKLQNTKKMARTKAILLETGSGYGALETRSSRTAHLEFQMNEPSLQKWKHFFETGVLHCPGPEEEPDQFLITADNVSFLETHMEGTNQNNWYAHYHLGLGYYIQERYEEARKEMQISYELEKNPWALHGLACIGLVTGEKEKAAGHILEGIKMRPEPISYLKEGFKILHLCEQYRSVTDLYEQLQPDMQAVGKIRFYYISALHQLGKDEQAYRLLEEGNGLEIPDIREGEDAIASLWTELNHSLTGEKKEVPHRYNFKAY